MKVVSYGGSGLPGRVASAIAALVFFFGSSGALSAFAQEAAPQSAVAPAPSDPVAAGLAEADRLWSLRAEGAQGGVALPGPIDGVIAACRQVISADPGSLEARWRLMRALYFKGEY